MGAEGAIVGVGYRRSVPLEVEAVYRHTGAGGRGRQEACPDREGVLPEARLREASGPGHPSTVVYVSLDRADEKDAGSDRQSLPSFRSDSAAVAAQGVTDQFDTAGGGHESVKRRTVLP